MLSENKWRRSGCPLFPNTFGILTATSGSLANPYQYIGREFDSETGLQYLRARYYSPYAGRFLTEDPLGFNSDSSSLYVYVTNNPANFSDPSGLSKETNWSFFWDWALGNRYGGPSHRDYGPNDVETQEMERSPGANELRNRFYAGHCQTVRRFYYGTVAAYWDTIANPTTADWGSTAAQVGGFAGASAINNGDGTVTFIIPNVAGTQSFFLHLVPDRKDPNGPGSNIYQTFHWTEPIQQCKCQ